MAAKKPKPKPKNKGGQPTKFNKEVKRQCSIMAKRGWTDEQMAELLGIHRDTLSNWKKRHLKFFDTLKDWKDEADRKVERCLYERACGFSCPEDKIFNNNGKPLVVPTTKHYPPDTTAAIFWLKNRKKDQWRDVQQREHTGAGGKDLKWITEIVDPSHKKTDEPET